MIDMMIEECEGEDRVQDQGLAIEDVTEDPAAVPGLVQGRVDVITAPDPTHETDVVAIDRDRMINRPAGGPGQDLGLHESRDLSQDPKIEIMTL